MLFLEVLQYLQQLLVRMIIRYKSEMACFFVVLWRKNEHKETRIGYKIRILGQNVQARIQNLFGN